MLFKIESEKTLSNDEDLINYHKNPRNHQCRYKRGRKKDASI